MDNGGNIKPSDGQQEKTEGFGVENGGNRKSTNPWPSSTIAGLSNLVH